MTQKIKSKQHDDGPRVAVHHGMKPLDAAVEKALSRLQDRHFTDYAAVFSDQFLYMEKHYLYLKDAEKAGISRREAMEYHDYRMIKEALKFYQDRTGGQKPRIVIHINSSEDRSGEIFSHGAYVDAKGKWIDGAFVISINVRKDSHFPEDFQPSAYINGHLIKHDSKGTAYEPFVASFGSDSKARGMDETDELQLACARREEMVRKYREAGFPVTDGNDGTPYRAYRVGETMHKTYLPVILHDTLECEYYVIEKDGKMLLEDWYAKMGLDSDPGVKKDIEALGKHRLQKWYFDEYINMTKTYKQSQCPDSRSHSHHNCTHSTMRILGSILTMDEMVRVLQTPGLEEYDNVLHLNCGYLTTAMKVHEAGDEIRRILDRAEQEGKADDASEARQFLKHGFESVASRKFKGFNLGDFYQMMSGLNKGEQLSKGTKGILHELLRSQNADMREIAVHMHERGILAWDDRLGTFIMPAAADIDKTLLESRLLPSNPSRTKEETQVYYDKITARVVQMVEDDWNAAFMKVEGTEVRVVNVIIEDYRDGRRYFVKNDLGLVDAHTKEAV